MSLHMLAVNAFGSADADAPIELELRPRRLASPMTTHMGSPSIGPSPPGLAASPPSSPPPAMQSVDEP